MATTWHHLETQYDRPLLVILDQVEEVYTQANALQPDELADRSLRLAGVRDGAGRGVRLNLAPLAV